MVRLSQVGSCVPSWIGRLCYCSEQLVKYAVAIASLRIEIGDLLSSQAITPINVKMLICLFAANRREIRRPERTSRET